MASTVRTASLMSFNLCDAAEPLAHPNALSIALAAAILIDLLQPQQRITVTDGGGAVFVGSRTLTGDPVADWAIRLLHVYRPQRVLHKAEPALSVRDALRQHRRMLGGCPASRYLSFHSCTLLPTTPPP